MTKKIIWRMGKLPTVEELRELVKDKIITQEEARGILFNSEDENKENRDIDSLKEEIKFLRNLIDTMARGKTSVIVEKIVEIQKPYIQQPWIKPYLTWGTINDNTTHLYNQPTTFNSIQTF